MSDDIESQLKGEQNEHIHVTLDNRKTSIFDHVNYRMQTHAGLSRFNNYLVDIHERGPFINIWRKLFIVSEREIQLRNSV